MFHEIYTVSDFEVVAPYTLRIRFNDDSVKRIDFWPMLRGELYGPLRDLDFFNQVRLDADAGTLVWPNEADFDPATLHDWDSVGEAMIAMANSWPEPHRHNDASTTQTDLHEQNAIY
ncbi:DUF2442 domain-containing protein [candidate division KSB1 bacterium]|nr:DUF2442 domain-containing protein [candidate division KSB1 bacterium]